MSGEEKKFPSLIIVLYTTAILCSLSLTNKIILFHGMEISGCLAVFPLLYFFGDVLAEVYGYRLVKQLLLYTFFACFLFSGVIALVVHTPYPAFYNNQKAFEGVFGLSLKFSIVGAVAIWAGGVVNAYVITRWKVLLHGKYFWMRSLGSTAIGELVNTVVAFPLAFGGVIPIKQIINLIVVAYIIKMIYAVILVFPATYMVGYYKRVLKIDLYDKAASFNPFSLKK